MSEPTGIVLTTFEDAGRRYALGKTKLRELANEGVIETVMVGSRRLIREASLLRLADEGCPPPNKGRKAKAREAEPATA